jgi:carbonic anhydrase/acetyltransferase-like protein (isoleucine patch superfamily)
MGIAAGTLGGWIEKPDNLSVSGNAWVSGNAQVYGDARVYGNAWVHGDALVYGDAWVSGNAQVYGSARVYGNALVHGDALVYGDAWVSGEIIVATRSDGYTFLVAPTSTDGLRIIAGCRYFTIDEARAHWTDTRGGTQLGDESLAIVDHLERMAAICGLTAPIEEAA